MPQNPGQLPPGLPIVFDDQLPTQVTNPDGSYKQPNLPQVFNPDPPTPNGTGGSVLTTKQCQALIPKILG